MKTIIISGEIGWDVWPAAIRRQINEAKGEEIEFLISSPGGYIYDGLEIFNMIRGYEGRTITVANGMAASMASYLLMAGDVKKATSNAVFMIHNARAWTGGDQNRHRKLANVLEGMSNMLAREYVGQAGQTKEEIKALMDEEAYFFGDEILEAGFVDEIIEAQDVGAEDGDATTKEEAVSETSAKVAAVIEKIKSKPEDMSKLAAVLKPDESPKNHDHQKLPPGGDNSATRQSAINPKPKEEETMTLEEFLASDPAAKAEYDKRLGEAKSQGIAEKQSEIDRIHPLISAEGASEALVEQGFKALKEGGPQVGVFVGIAEYEARQSEKEKADATGKEQKPDVPPEGSQKSTDGILRNEEDEAAAIAEMKQG